MATRSEHPLAAGKLPGDLLARLIETYRTPPDDAVIVEASYGFDAAALRIGDETLVVKSDPITFATENAAHYLVAVNANDIACLGGIPRWITVVALLPENLTTEASVESMFRDLQAACTKAGVTVLGGHTEITLQIDRPLLVGTMLGTAGPDGLLIPGGASAGDELYVTKSIGIEGTALLAAERADTLQASLSRHLLEGAANLIHDPGISVVRDAQLALSTGCVTALHDPTEGGLATAVHEISEASGLGARLELDHVPIRDDTAAICQHFNIDPLGLLSSGALLIAAKPGTGATLNAGFAKSGIAITRIGTLTQPGDKLVLASGSDTTPLPRYDADELTRALAHKDEPMTATRPPIIMYGRTTFCPDVARARMRLEDLGYEWTEYDVEKDPARKDEMTTLTGRGNVPTLVIGDSILVEPSNDELDKALVAAGYDVSDDE